MFVPVRHWSYVMAALGVLLLAVAIMLLVTTS
jgi:hypothetical protein